MNTRSDRVFGARFMLATALATFAVFARAQDASLDVDTFEPAVDTSADIEPAVDTSATFEPAVDTAANAGPVEPTAVLAADVTRQESGGRVMDRMELGRTEITGNQELPKVLYIVPWQKSDPGELTGRPVNTLLDEVLAPLDREEFLRQVDYHGDLYEEE